MYEGKLEQGDKVKVWITGRIGDFVCEVTETCKLHGYHMKVLEPTNDAMTGATIKGEDYLIREKL